MDADEQPRVQEKGFSDERDCLSRVSPSSSHVLFLVEKPVFLAESLVA